MPCAEIVSYFIFSVPSHLLLLILQRLQDGCSPSAAIRVLTSSFALHRCPPSPACLFLPSACDSVSRTSDLSALWNMKSFARHRLLQEPIALVNHDAGMPMSKL
jgi:hypothetical protein